MDPINIFVANGLALPGKKASELAKLWGVAAPRVSEVKKGERAVKANELRIAERYFGIAYDDDTATTDVRVYDIRAAAGDGAQIFDNNEEMAGTLTFEHGYIRTLTNARPDQLMIIQAYGDSMEPTIPSDAWVMIDTTQIEVMDRQIYAFRDGDDGRIKRILRHPTKPEITLHSDNDAWPPITEVNPSQLNIIGRAIWFSKKLV